MFVTLLAFLAMSTHGSNPVCATISNENNHVQWRTKSGRVISTTYEDRGDPALMYGRRVPIQVKYAEEALQYGAPGIRTITVCS